MIKNIRIPVDFKSVGPFNASFTVGNAMIAGMISVVLQKYYVQ